MSAKSDREAAREAVAAYHETQLAALVERVGSAIDRFRGGQLNAFDVDQVLFHYSRAAKELWKFCNLGDTELAANTCASGRRFIGGSAGPQGNVDAERVLYPRARSCRRH